MARSGNIFILFAGLNRARRGQLERCRSVVVVVTPASVGRQDSVATTSRGLPAKWVSKPSDERSTCVEIKASQVLQPEIAESWLRRSRGHLWGVGAEFSAETVRQATRWILILERRGVMRWILILERHGGCEMDPHFKIGRAHV